MPTAVIPSQFAGWWLATVLKRGWVLLREDMSDLRPSATPPDPQEVVALEPAGGPPAQV